MKKDLGVHPYLFPMPTYMIGTYNEDGSVDVMMMAWGGICAEDRVALNLEADHKTVENLKKRGAFTLAIPGVDTIKESDYFGIASSNKVPDKFEKTGLHSTKSEKVDAPVVEEYPITLECEVEKIEDEPYGLRILGKIIGVLADEKVLNNDGKIAIEKLGAFSFDQINNSYYATGEKVGQAWSTGAEYINK